VEIKQRESATIPHGCLPSLVPGARVNQPGRQLVTVRVTAALAIPLEDAVMFVVPVVSVVTLPVESTVATFVLLETQLATALMSTGVLQVSAVAVN